MLNQLTVFMQNTEGRLAQMCRVLADAGINTAVLNFGTFFTANLIPVTLGNIVGGALVGLMMYFAHAERKK